MGIKTVPFIDIHAKSPDAPPIDFFAFGLLKSALFKRRLTTLCGLLKRALLKRRHTTLCGLREDVQEKREEILLPILQKTLLTPKLLRRKIVKNKGYETEQLKHQKYGI
ncbi:hypothetical protein AVEN_175260-1 [Araneus ventricosus]|uniref:Uncharacterized protein n=1 Tax=Araneus ventricosus TaxID=182803 RepID=A0A4Y2F240_ARAVE|nr:hypothetical protein AVEN_175260-1 [Araneus ventricosus]